MEEALALVAAFGFCVTATVGAAVRVDAIQRCNAELDTIVTETGACLAASSSSTVLRSSLRWWCALFISYAVNAG